jgi:hypothetical protein
MTVSDTTPPAEPTQPVDPAVSHADNELVQRLSALQTKTETFRVELESLQQELAELVELPEEGPVNATFDTTGRLASLEIDREGSADLEPSALIAEINYAIARASQNQASFGISLGNEASGTSTFLDQLLASATSGLSSEPKVTANDLSTVTVTTIAGSLVAIDCSEPWIRQSSPASIAEEIIRVTNVALEEDDPMGRRTSEDSNG